MSKLTDAADKCIAEMREDVAAGRLPADVGSVEAADAALDTGEWIPYGERYTGDVRALVDARIRAGDVRA